MPNLRIPSPARSQSALVTPRRLKPRGPRSVGSPARSNTSVRLSSVIQNFKDKNMDSFRLSPLNSRRSVLNDNTDIEEPRRHSWWKNLNDTSRDILDVLENDKQDGAYNVMEEYMDGEVVSQEKKDKHETLDLPDSSDSESISSIIIPQRKLFTQNENQPKNKFAQFLGTRESMAKHNKTNVESDKNDKTILATKKLFGQSSKSRSKPAFPTELLRFSPDKTVNKTAGEVKGQVRNLFGNRAGVKRKNKFADFIASESEEEPEIQPKVFGFQKKHDAPTRRVSTASRGARDTSPASSVTTDIDMEDWKLLPSSTMVQTQLEAMMVDSPAKKARLSKLSEGKESEAATNSTVTINKTKQSNKSIVSKNKSKLSTSKTMNKSKMSPEVNTSVRKSGHYTKNNNDDQNMQSEFDEEQVANSVQNNVKATINKSRDSNKSVTAKNKSKMNNSKNSSIKRKSTLNEVLPENDEQNLEFDIDEGSNDIDNAEQIMDSTTQPTSIVSKNTSQILTTNKSLNMSKASSKVNNSVQRSILKEAIPENDEQEMDLQFDEENKEVVTDADIPENLGGVDNVEEKDENQIDISNRSNKEQSYKSVTRINKSPGNEEKEMDIVQETRQKFKGAPDGDQIVGNDNDNGKSNVSANVNNKSTKSKSKRNLNISEMTSNINENLAESILNEAVPEKDQQELDDNEENRLALTYSDEEPMEQENEELSENDTDDNKVDSEDVCDAMNISQNINSKNSEKIGNDDEEEKEVDEEESPEIKNQSQISDDDKPESDVEEEEIQEMDQMDESQEMDNDEPSETEEDNEVIEGENASQEVEVEEQEESENEDIEQDEEEIEVEEDEENENEAIVNDSVGDEVIEESDVQNDEGTNDEENHEVSATEEESPNVTHDTTGRNRKKDETNVRSPEAVLRNDSNQMDSFTAKGRNTSIRRTTMLKSLTIRPSLAPPRESTGLSDGTRNSSAEGSGWDSHRTTRKTLRQTFGRDFTPRKSLRALVMEKSAARHTVFNELNNVDMPRANSTELPEASNREVEEFEDPHEISKRTRQTTLEMYLQKIKKQNMEKKKKLEEEVRSSLTAPSKDILNPFKVPSRPFVLKRAKPQSKPKTKTIKSIIPIENLPQDLLEDMKYKPPKRFQPSNASWITKRLYKFLETKLEPKYDYKARVRSEKLVETIYNFVKDLRRHEVAPHDAVELLKREMARLCVINTHFEFYQFFHDFLPREVRIKVVPDVVNKIPLPRHGVFSEIHRGDTVQG